MALRSVSFVDLDWAAEDEKSRVRVNRRKEQKKRHGSSSNKDHRRNQQLAGQQSKAIIMSTLEQQQVQAFISFVGKIEDEEDFQTICAIDSAKAFLKLLEPMKIILEQYSTDRGILVYYCNPNFHVWKNNDALFAKAFEWMKDATDRVLYFNASFLSTPSADGGSAHDNYDADRLDARGCCVPLA
jgi:hypothetical protein